MGNLKNLLKDLSNTKFAILFLCIGTLIYANTLFNGFISDDYLLIVNNSSVHSLFNIPLLFFQGNFGSDSKQTNNYYRPIFSTAITLIYSLSFGNAFGFHLSEILLHVINTYLIFLLFNYFFNKEKAFFLSLLFLVHPINTEAVTYISALQEPLFLVFGLLALYFLRKHQDNTYLFYVVGFLELLALLSKETAIIFLILVPIFSKLFLKSKSLIGYIIQSFVVLLIYLFLRFAIARIYFNHLVTVPIMSFSLSERIINIPKIVFFYLKTFFYPKYLIMFQSWVVRQPNLQDFYLPLVISITFFTLLLLTGFIIYRNNRNFFKIFLFFLIWFILGLGLHIQIFPLDQTVSDRWFYFPIVGLLGLAGVIAEYFKIVSRFRIISLSITLAVIVLLSARAITRNANWKNESTLYNHDIKYNDQSYQLVKGLGLVAYSNGKINEAESYFNKSAELYPSQMTYSTLGYFYLKVDNPEIAAKMFEKAISYDENFAISWGNLALAEYKSGDKENAIIAARKAYSIEPTRTMSSIINAIENNKNIKINITIR